MPAVSIAAPRGVVNDSNGNVLSAPWRPPGPSQRPRTRKAGRSRSWRLSPCVEDGRHVMRHSRPHLKPLTPGRGGGYITRPQTGSRRRAPSPTLRLTHTRPSQKRPSCANSETPHSPRSPRWSSSPPAPPSPPSALPGPSAQAPLPAAPVRTAVTVSTARRTAAPAGSAGGAPDGASGVGRRPRGSTSTDQIGPRHPPTERARAHAVRTRAETFPAGRTLVVGCIPHSL